MKHPSLELLAKAAAVSFLAVTVAFAWASWESCSNEVPDCAEVIGYLGDVVCDTTTGDKWQIGASQPFWFYACNAYYSGCGGPSDDCNVMVRYSGWGRYITCPSRGITRFCADSITSQSQQALKRDCSGNFCDVPGGLDANASGVEPDWENFEAKLALGARFVILDE